MRMKIRILLLCTIPCSVAFSKIYSWDYLMSEDCLYQDFGKGVLNPLRHLCSLDLNNDDVNDLILSDSVSLGGTGGIPYNIYLGIGENNYIKLGGILAKTVAIEEYHGRKRLWWYTHSSSQSGSLGFYWFYDDYIYHRDALGIHPGDGGTNIGNAIMAAILTKESCITFQKLKPQD